MQLNKRLTYISYLIISFIFIVTGLALKEMDILAGAFKSSPEEWYEFLFPWVGNLEGGIPVPWE